VPEEIIMTAARPRCLEHSQMTQGRVNPSQTLEDQGMVGLGTVYYNLLEPALIEHALKRDEGTLGQGGTFLVSTGTFTGRSPKATHVV
jgi:phosphoenolpyruvate carboxykinase (ATP)